MVGIWVRKSLWDKQEGHLHARVSDRLTKLFGGLGEQFERSLRSGSGQALLQDVRQLVPFSAIRYSIITQPPVLYTASSSYHSRCIKRGVALVKIAHLRRWAITV